MSNLPAQRYQDKISKIKETVKKTHEYFKHNYDRYNEFRKFVFQSSLTPDEITLLTSLGRPQLEFNILESYISRLLGEFSKQEPSVEVSAADPKNADPAMIKIIEAHIRHILMDHENHTTRYEVYKDILSGGFSVLKVHTDYESPMSMKQNIYIDRVFDPTLCGFDILARESHKGDGRYCFELFPRSKEEFKDEYPDISLEDISFRRDFSGFNWSYVNDNTETLIVADYYEKKEKNISIVQVRDGRVMTLEKYNKMLAEWSDITAPPAIVGKPRRTQITNICRYRCIENMVIEYEETDYNCLPLVFVDGNSILIKENLNSNVRQVTRPYVYQAKGSQRLKNWAGISLANEIENIVQHKFMVAKEAIPKEEEFLEAYKDVQKASVLVYNSVYEGNPDQPINSPISPIPKIAAPPEILQAFTGTDTAIQQTLGMFDAAMGKNENDISGIAMIESITQSNAVAMPYVVGWLEGWQRCLQLVVELIPKYYVTPRTIPTLDEEGKRYYIDINQPYQPKFEYEENALNVTVKAGPSFQVQKSRTIMMIKEMMGMSPLFQQFIAEKGMNFVLDNMEGRGIEQLKEEVDSYEKEMQQQKQAAMQQQQQNPAVMRNQIDMQKLQLDSQKMNLEHKIDMLKLELEHNKIDADLHMTAEKDKMDLTRAMIDHHDKSIKNHIDHNDKEKKHHLAHHEAVHKMAKETVETLHKVTQKPKEEKKE